MGENNNNSSETWGDIGMQWTAWSKWAKPGGGVWGENTLTEVKTAREQEAKNIGIYLDHDN